MNGPIEAMQVFFYLLGGIGLFFTGVGILWFASIYKKLHQKKAQL